MEISINLVIIGITALVSFLALQDHRLLERLILWPPAINKQHQYERFITSGLIHADFSHFLFNMVTLYFFGGLIEQVYNELVGPAGYILFYVGALIVSDLPTYYRHRNNPAYRSLGASGAVSAVLFAFVLMSPWSTLLIFFIPMPAIIYAVLYMGYTFYMDRQSRMGRGDNINHSAHLWGAIYGIVVTIVLEPGLVGYFFEQLLQPRFL